VRFKIDENLPVELAEELRAAGDEAATVGDQQLVGASDRRLSEACKIEGRIFVTLDLDFAAIRTYPPGEHPGPIVLRLLRQDELHVVEVFRRMLRVVETEPLGGSPLDSRRGEYSYPMRSP
jgi:predicted nuclease of predicted toxin-antitoxin system